ncbi:MAG: hypothetical protein RIQ78_972 [Bacteroidota bacterium]
MHKKTFFRWTNTPLIMRFFLFWKLPAAWFTGIGVLYCDAQKTVVRLPYGWRSQNPFRSTYFAAQCAAGELSTGLLALAQLQEKPPISMLVTHIEASFLKKSSDTLLFTCEDGDAIATTIEKMVQSGEAQTFTATATGRLPDETIACVVHIRWSFKAKQLGR